MSSPFSKKFIGLYNAEKNGYANICHYADDGWSRAEENNTNTAETEI